MPIKCALFPELLFQFTFFSLLIVGRRLSNSRREEYALVGSELWLLGISVFAVSACVIKSLTRVA